VNFVFGATHLRDRAPAPRHEQHLGQLLNLPRNPVGVGPPRTCSRMSSWRAAHAGAIYVLDIIYNFRTAFITVHNLRRSIVRDPGLIAEYYMRHGTFWPDLLAALPIVAEARRPARPRACVAQPARPVQAVASGS